IAPDALTSARDACASLEAGQVCLGAGEVEGGGLITVGTTAALASVDSLVSTSGSITLLAMQADLPESAGPLRLVLFGDASITDAYEGVQPPFPTITVKNGPVNILNLRATPTETGEIVGTMGWSEQLVADGRSSDGAWYRVQKHDLTGWVFAALVTVTEGEDASTLVVLDSPITQPMQSLTLETGAETCGGGLLVQAASDSLAHLEINGALLTLARAALLVHAPADSPLTIQVLSGSADVQANGENLLAETGSQVNIAADAAPERVERYPFSTLSSAPLDLLPPEALTCTAGVLEGAATLYDTPGGDAVGELPADSNATITGYFTADDGTVWWLVNNQAWVAGNDVETAGVCEAVSEVSSSAAQQNISQPVTSNTSFASNQVPPGRSIWVANTGSDNLSGVCTAPPIAQCDHLAAVTTQPNGTITWLGQEPQPYTLSPSGDNSYRYSGRNQLNNASLSLTITFTSTTNWVGTMNIVYDADSGCTHTFNYTAAPR
ncbi:MAG: SH3 domain-containing protein, partial [Chloroflexota bacterium]